MDGMEDVLIEWRAARRANRGRRIGRRRPASCCSLDLLCYECRRKRPFVSSDATDLHHQWQWFVSDTYSWLMLTCM